MWVTTVPILEPGLEARHDGDHLVAGPLPIGCSQAQLRRPRGTPFSLDQYLQEGPKGLGENCFRWQPKTGPLAFRSLTARVVECHHSDGKGAKAGAQG